MSASLVGSEMCIRDRLGPAGRPRPQCHPCGAEAPSRFRPMSCSEPLLPCLLYTSDAADDM
eukprot:7481822-Alexandrium_andersonii.AAC.1